MTNAVAKPAQDASAVFLRFGEFALDPAAGELHRNGSLVRLQPQQLQLLLVLTGEPGRVITRGELHKALWAEQTFVEFEDSLNHAIIRLRSALGDSAQAPRYIETLPRRGYRFIAKVESEQPRATDIASVAGRSLSATRIALIVLLAIALLALAGSSTRPEAGLASRSLAPSHAIRPEAYAAYLKGRQAAAIWTPERLREAVKYFEEAVEKDPKFALAYAELGHAYGMLGFAPGFPPDENARKFRWATQQSLELDDRLAEAHINLGDIRFYGDWDWAGGEAEFRRAVELDPKSQEAQGHYAFCLEALGRNREALREMERALKLDPLAPRVNLEYAGMLLNNDEPERAIQQYQTTLTLEPGYAAAFAGLGAAYERLHRDDEAIAAYLRAASLSGEDPERVKSWSDAYSAGGLRGYWAKRLEHLKMAAQRQAVSPLAFALLYVRLGENDLAIEWLNRAYQQHVPALAWINGQQQWLPLRSDPRFQALVKRMNFPG